MCDIRLAADGARMGITESRIGLLAPFASILPKLFPMATVMELVLTGEPITAQRAYEIGFVNKVVLGEKLMEEATAVAQQIAANAPLSVQSFKELAYRGLDMSAQAITSLTYHMYDSLLLSGRCPRGSQGLLGKTQAPVERPVSPGLGSLLGIGARAVFRRKEL